MLLRFRVKEEKIIIIRSVAEHPKQQPDLSTMMYPVKYYLVKRFAQPLYTLFSRRKQEFNLSIQVVVRETRKEIANASFDLLSLLFQGCEVGEVIRIDG